jgi:hypothetical protein
MVQGLTESEMASTVPSPKLHWTGAKPSYNFQILRMPEIAVCVLEL